MSSRQSSPLKIVYCIMGIALLLCSGYIVGILVMHIWHKAPGGEHVDADMAKGDRLFKEMTERPEVGNQTAAYKNINAIQRSYDFHKVERTAVLDSQNLCVSCHGDIPHYKKKETRAFLNMHAFFMACETCHIRSKSGMETKFVWYDKTTGEETEKINLNHFLGNTPYKLMPVGKDGTRLYDSERMVKYVAEFKSKAGKMMPSEKGEALEVIHETRAEINDSVKCGECHKSDRAAGYLPFEQIGYPERRTNQLVGNEVVGMIGKYKNFYLPGFLIPKTEAGSEK